MEEDVRDKTYCDCEAGRDGLSVAMQSGLSSASRLTTFGIVKNVGGNALPNVVRGQSGRHLPSRMHSAFQRPSKGTVASKR
jgi:hypothetical protein